MWEPSPISLVYYPFSDLWSYIVNSQRCCFVRIVYEYPTDLAIIPKNGTYSENCNWFEQRSHIIIGMLRYVDDTVTAVHKDELDDFHEHLKRQNADIQFTKEIEENGKIPFLDCLVTRDNNEPTHTDRLLDQSSYNPTSHKSYDYTDPGKTRATTL